MRNQYHEESILRGFSEFEHCFDVEDVANSDFEFEIKMPEWDNWYRESDGVCITSLSIEGDQLLVGKNNNLQSFWLDRDQHYCLDDFMSTPHIKIRISYQNSNAQVISSRCKDRK